MGIEVNCKGFVASSKMKFFYDDVIQVLSMEPPLKW